MMQYVRAIALAALLASASLATARENGPFPAPQTYKLTGVRQLRPSSITDDGAKMYLSWPPEAELPAIFALDSRGQEVMVDVWARDGKLVIDTVHPRLVFRLDREVARAERMAMKP